MTDIGASDPPPVHAQRSTVDAAKEQTTAVGQSAKDAGSDVVAQAKDQTQRVASEAGRQTQDLYRQVRGQLGDQASTQQKRAVGGLYALGHEVGQMAEQGGQSGPATHVARQASEKINDAARWLDSREPGHVLDDVKRYARRNPGTFLLGAAVLGVLAGRLTKNLGSPDATASSGWPSMDADDGMSGQLQTSTTTYVSGSGTTGSTVPSAQPVATSTATSDPSGESVLTDLRQSTPPVVPAGGVIDTPTRAMPPAGYPDDEEPA
jgi:hypothetical protein